MGKKSASKTSRVSSPSSLLSLAETFNHLLLLLMFMPKKQGDHFLPRQSIPSFDLIPDENLDYKCMLERKDYSDEDEHISSVLALRIMESKIRLALTGEINGIELLVWQKALRLRDDEINKNLQTFFKRLHKPI